MLYKKVRKSKQGKVAILLLLFSSLHMYCSAQSEKEYVFGTFRSSQLINVQTTEMVQPKSFEFSIRHRFGMIGPDSTLYEQFLGLDLPTNISFSFLMPVNNKLNIGIGRTKYEKIVDGQIKYLVLRQTEDNSMPVSLAAYLNIAMKTGRFSKLPEFAFYNDSTTPFSYNLSHRLSYCYEIICSRKFSEKFSMQVAPALHHRNLVTPGFENSTLSLPVSIMYKTGLNSSLAAEYAYRFNNRPSKRLYPLSVAWEIGTSGHTFQIVISSSNELVEQEIYFKDNYDYRKGYFSIGFNIKRTFWFKKSHKKA